MSARAPIHLGVNVDHVATLRQARRSRYPDPVMAALIAEKAGADSITMHLREDRRHIQDRDVDVLGRMIKTRMNLEMAVTDPMLEIARARAPTGLLLRARAARGAYDRRRARCRGPGAEDRSRVRASARARHPRLAVHRSRFRADRRGAAAGAPVVELHTGAYAEAAGAAAARELERLARRRSRASLGLTVHAGHGLNYHNVRRSRSIPEIVELNIGHAIVAQALFDGFAGAVAKMKALMVAARA